MTEKRRWQTPREMMGATDRGLLDDPAAFTSGFGLDEPGDEVGHGADEAEPQRTQPPGVGEPVGKPSRDRAA